MHFVQAHALRIFRGRFNPSLNFYHSQDKGHFDGNLNSFTIQMPTSLKAGTVTFHVNNIDTAAMHEFVIFKTDLSPDKLPLNSDGTVNEQGQGLTHIDEVSDLAPGASQDLTVTLHPGNYIALCNLPGHFKAGMYTVFTVK